MAWLWLILVHIVVLTRKLFKEHIAEVLSLSFDWNREKKNLEFRNFHSFMIYSYYLCKRIKLEKKIFVIYLGMGLSSLQLWGCEPQMWVIGSSIKSVTNQWCKWCIFCPLIWYQSLLTKVVLVPFENSFEQRSFLWFCICFSPVFYICICICVQHWSCVIGGHWAGIGEPEMGSLLQTSIIVAKNWQSVCER